jgi:hypothetical protein
MSEFLKLLFNDGEWVVQADKFWHTQSHPINFNAKSELFCLNPIHPNSTRREDDLVGFRNILVEMDHGSRYSQVNHINKCKMPFTTAVWSGGRSMHFIISLTEFVDKKKFKSLCKRIHIALERKNDPQCQNGAAFSRLPDVKREATGNQQELMEVRSKVSLADLEAWLLERGVEDLPERVFDTTVSGMGDRFGLSGFTLNCLFQGVHENRNATCFRMACDFAQKGWPMEECFERVSGVTDLPETELNSVVKSAYKFILKEST